MSQSNAKKVRKQIKSGHQTWVTARWRWPLGLLPGLKKGYFEITLFPKLQWLFHFRLVHAVEMPVVPTPKRFTDREFGVLRRIWEAASDYKMALCNDEFANQFGGVDALKKILFDLIDEYEVGEPLSTPLNCRCEVVPIRKKYYNNAIEVPCHVISKLCPHYICQLDNNREVAIEYCRHSANPVDSEGNCTAELCQLPTKNPIKGDE